VIKKVINRYKNAFENLEIKNVHNLLNLVDENVMFEDPFNKIIGKENFKKLLLEMFKKLQKPKFKVLNIYYKQDLTIIKWTFSCEIFRKEIYFDGLSEVTVKNGKIIKHLDFWDSGKNLYTQIPFLGRIFKKIHNV
tara:strand:- start:287 stop:694 length:408 start_codon:yes stop_codon:yes gene_type:complete